MKQIVYPFAILLALVNCTEKTEENADQLPSDSLSSISSKRREKEDTSFTTSSNEKWAEDSLYIPASVPRTESEEEMMNELQPQDSNFVSLELKEISKHDFDTYESRYAKRMKEATADKDYFKLHGLYIAGDCHEICEDYLVEIESQRKMLLPSNYDAGIIGVPLSPAGKKFVVYSSYDGFDYKNYYNHRSELFAYTIEEGRGLDAVKPMFTYYTRDFSIANVTWIDENTIALKIYEEDRLGDGSHLNYRYLKSQIK